MTMTVELAARVGRALLHHSRAELAVTLAGYRMLVTDLGRRDGRGGPR